MSDPEGRVLYASPSLAGILGYAPERLQGQTIDSLVHPDDLPRVRAARAQLQAGGAAPVALRLRARHADGTWRWLEGSGRNLQAEPRIRANVVFLRDITAPIETEQALVASEQRYRHIVTEATDIIFQADFVGTFLYVNPVTERVMGYSREELIGRRFYELIRQDYRDAVIEFYRRQRDDRVPSTYFEFPAITRDGREIWFGQHVQVVAGAGGEVVVQAVARDITERRRTEQALREAEAKYRSLIEQSLIGVFIVQRGRLRYANPKAAEMFGYTPEEMLALPSAEALLHRDDRRIARAQVRRRLRGAVARVEYDVRGLRKDGTVIELEVHGSRLQYEGAPAVIEVALDITDSVRLEEQLRQAQKMEAIGRLAGGIAHDFNNLLTAIHGNAELLLHRLAGDHEAATDVHEILHASERAAALTRQLLAFSRKQILQPLPLDLNHVITEVGDMCRRLIGADVRLVTRGQRDLHVVLADPTQIEQVLMNLIVNARDAMPDGGQIIIDVVNAGVGEDDPRLETLSMAPGRYVQLTVTDTGIGMDAETQARIFEPFFTTKEQGKGTGLGLSTVYGIVKQTGGYISVDSQLGSGTTFAVYLPAAGGPSGASGLGRDATAVRGSEAVLVVEDDEPVRALAVRLLKGQGYRVIEARNGVEALHAAERQQAPIDLLLTDVVMPGMGGRDLVARLTAVWPRLKVLYMSAFTDDATVSRGVQPGTAFMPKPFTSRELARRVREVLDTDGDPSPEVF